MQFSRNFFVLSALVALPLLTRGGIAQAQTSSVAAPQATTRTQVFKESNATSGQYSQHWANDRDAQPDHDNRGNNQNIYPGDNRRDRHDGSVIIGSNAACAPTTNNTVIFQSYPGYPVYNQYPAYPYGYGNSVSGSSVTVSTPGYNDGTFNVFPWTTTVTTFNSTPNYYGYRNYQNCQPYPAFSSYPAYPTYANPGLQGYRGAAGGYNFNGGSFPSGAYITGSTSGYSSGFSAGFSTGRTTVNIGGRR